jgi:hypothetical protein
MKIRNHFLRICKKYASFELEDGITCVNKENSQTAATTKTPEKIWR